MSHAAEKTYRVAEVARITCLSIQTVRNLMSKGLLPAYRLPNFGSGQQGEWRCHPADLVAFLEKHEIPYIPADLGLDREAINDDR